jgi:hypothetical protein
MCTVDEGNSIAIIGCIPEYKESEKVDCEIDASF